MSDDDATSDEVIAEVVENISKKVPRQVKKGRLNNHRVYLAGPIDHVDDDGTGWRQNITPYLKKMGLTILDPTDKPTSQCKWNEIGEEKEHIQKLVDLRRWDELNRMAKEIVLVDLRMVEVSDFMICYVDKDTHLCGTYDELFEEIDLSGLVENKGIMYIWNDQNLKSRELEINIRNEIGAEQQLLSKSEIHDLEPNIKNIYHAGVFYKKARHARNPGKIWVKLFESFVKKGGKFLKLNIQDIHFDNDKPVLSSDNQKFTLDKVVIACGAFSKKLTDNLDENIPLDTERGYHVHFKNCDHLLSRPVIFSNRGFGITPMDQGLRVVGTVEFGGLENPLSKSRVKNLINNAKYMLGDLPEHEDEWLGFRPSLPDFLPVMGPSKNHKNVYYCFGHHHLGWTLGPISGKIVSGMIANENTNLNLDPYSSKRFS